MLYLLGVALVVFAFLGDEHCVRLLERLRALGIGDLSQSAVLRALPGRLSFAKTPSVGQAVDMSAGHGQRPSVGLPHWIPMISSLQPKIVDYGLEKMYLVTTAPAPITSKRTTSCVVVPFTGILQQTCFKRERSTDP